jgi:hypothetical protein
VGTSNTSRWQALDVFGYAALPQRWEAGMRSNTTSIEWDSRMLTFQAGV